MPTVTEFLTPVLALVAWTLGGLALLGAERLGTGPAPLPALEVTVRAERCIGKSLAELALPGDVLVLAMRRNGDYLVPHGQTRLASGDLLTFIGSQEWVESTRASVFASYT